MNTPRRDPESRSQLAASRTMGGPVGWLLDLFSSVRLGIVLLVILFIYSSLGSAGIVLPTRGPADFTFLGIGFQHSMVRQWRIFEMTEFEWFHTTFFNANIALICINIIVTTFRRIRFSVLNLGVWTIHTGIIILCIGSVVYFATKVEGDAPVIRRDVVIEVPGVTQPVRFAALPDSSTSVLAPGGEYQFRVSEIDPTWSLRSAGDEGRTAFAVSLEVSTPEQSFVRTLLAGFPEYTEDVLIGRGRVKKIEEFEGRALIDESLKVSLEPRPATEFWLRETAAVYARPVTSRQWAMRPIHGLPRYNDYVNEPDRDVWAVSAPGDPYERKSYPLAIDVKPLDTSAGGPPDPLAGSQVRITGFLRYAVLTTGWMDGGEAFNPLVDITLRSSRGDVIGNETLLAFDPQERARFNGNMVFDWVSSAEELARYEQPSQRLLKIRIPETGEELSIPVMNEELANPDRQMIPIGPSGFGYKILDIVDRLPLSDGTSVTLLRVHLSTPDSTFTRWVFEDPARNRDNPETMAHEPHSPQPPDERIETVYEPGHIVPLTIVAGPGEVGVRVYSRDEDGTLDTKRLSPGATVEVVDGMRLTVHRLVTHARPEMRPRVIPWQQRDKDADAMQLYALVRVEISGGGRTEARWIPFHRYAFASRAETPPNLSRYEPGEFALADGSRVEVIVSRERMALPNPVLLDDFNLTTHVGGFSGRVSSIRDWTSIVRFQSESGLSETRSISTNAPEEYAGLWFFQAFWDAPQPGRSNGLAFTGLGVGNRNGVYTQLTGCCIAVAGMMYAFYVKPIIRRRRKELALEAYASGRNVEHKSTVHAEFNGAGGQGRADAEAVRPPLEAVTESKESRS